MSISVQVRPFRAINLCHSTKKNKSDSYPQLRKFVAKYSAGLRVRISPTLQSEQIGVVPPNCVISFVDEVILFHTVIVFLYSEMDSFIFKNFLL